MTASEWDGTPWQGSAQVVTKAAIGPGVGFYGSGIPMMDYAKTPQQMMKRAQMAYHVNPWVGSAEAVVTRKVVGLDWHLEDGNDEEYAEDNDDKGVPSPPDVKAARLLIERPQFLLPQNGRKPGTSSRRLMWSLTSRHIGLCGMAYWYADGLDSRGIPTAWLYINPARMWPAEDDMGNLTGWVLDAKTSDGRGGTPLFLEEVLPFYLDPPDWGNLGTGLYERAVLKTQITHLADQHSAYVLGTGGRIAGIVSPREGSIPDDKFKSLVNEFRNVNEAPDAAKRTTIMQGPTDFTPTAADPAELTLVELAKMNRDDVFTIWGVPGSQAPVQQAAGLNSGSTKGYDEAILMQGAVHDRVVAIREALQYGWLDKYLPTVIELEIEEPEFDDDTPAYERLAKAERTALTNAQRWDIIGVPPTGDPAIDNAILLPSTIALWATAPSEGQATGVIESDMPPPVSPFPNMAPNMAPMKASPVKEFLGLRKTLDKRVIPAIRRSVTEALAGQRADVVAWIRAHGEHLTRKPTDTGWWNAEREQKRLVQAIRPHVAGIAELVTARGKDVFPAKADPFEERVAAFVWSRTGQRIRDMEATTRRLVMEAIAQGFADGLAPGQIADILEESSIFDPVRAELIARTETMLAYNDAALNTYTEYGIEMVEPLDGDEDPECIARLERGPVSIEAAMDDTDHPNGTLDWMPYYPAKAEPPPKPETSPLSVIVQAAAPYRPAMRLVVERDPYGKIASMYEEPVEA